MSERLTDNQLNARIGRLLFGHHLLRLKGEVDSRWALVYDSDNDRSIRFGSTCEPLPDDEAMGRGLAETAGMDFATGTTWAKPLRVLATLKGLHVPRKVRNQRALCEAILDSAWKSGCYPWPLMQDAFGNPRPIEPQGPKAGEGLAEPPA